VQLSLFVKKILQGGGLGPKICRNHISSPDTGVTIGEERGHHVSPCHGLKKYLIQRGKSISTLAVEEKKVPSSFSSSQQRPIV